MSSQSESLLIPMRMVFLMWLSLAIQTFTFFDFSYFGIYPRTLRGSIGILTSPLVHANINHLAANTLPFLVLAGALFFFFPIIARRVFYGIYFGSGAMVWLLGRSSIHIGASGVVYGLASFLIFFGFFKKDVKSVLIAVVVISLYGGMIYGIFPQNIRVSWESHLLGAVVGFGFASFYGRKKSKSY